MVNQLKQRVEQVGYYEPAQLELDDILPSSKTKEGGKARPLRSQSYRRCEADSYIFGLCLNRTTETGWVLPYDPEMSERLYESLP